MVKIYKDMSNEEYHGNKTHFSSSQFKEALKSARHFHEKCVLRLTPETPLSKRGALDLGSYIHTMILEPHLLEKEFEVFSGKTRGKAFTAFAAENPSKVCITFTELQTAEMIAHSFNTQSIDLGDGTIPCKEIFKGGEAEVSIFSELQGLPVKIRPDYYKINHEAGIVQILDLKTCSTGANGVGEAKYLTMQRGYDLSGAMYLDVFRTAFKKLKIDPTYSLEFILVFASKKDYAINAFRISEETLNFGRDKYLKGLGNILRWQKNGYKEGLREV